MESSKKRLSFSGVLTSEENSMRGDGSSHSTERNQFIDVLKGAAIFLMLWGHCIQCCYPPNMDFYLDRTFKIIYSFHMPLFMIISGYVFCLSSRNKNKKNLLSRKVGTILKAIVGGTIFQYCFTTALQDILINRNLLTLVDGHWIDRLDGLWFLWSILSATIVMCMIEQYAEHWYHHVFIFFAGVFLVAALPNARNNLYMYPYFVIGYYFARYYRKSVIERLKYLSLIIFPILVMFYDKKHYIYTSGLFGSDYSFYEYLLIDGYRWLIGLVGSIFIITAFQLLMSCKLLKSIGNRIAMIGQKSLQIYVLSTVFLSSYLPIILPVLRRNSFVSNVYTFVFSNRILYDIIFMFILALTYTVVLFWITKLLEKTKLSKFIFGR